MPKTLIPSSTLLFLLSAIFALQPRSASADDLRVISLDVSLQRDGTTDTTSPFAYQVGAQSAKMSLELESAWYSDSPTCDLGDARPDLDVLIVLQATPASCGDACTDDQVTSKQLAHISLDGSTDVQRLCSSSLVGTGESKQLNLDFATVPDLHQWAAARFAAGDNFRIGAYLDPLNQIAEDGSEAEANNFQHEPLADIIPLSGKVGIGPTGNAVMTDLVSYDNILLPVAACLNLVDGKQEISLQATNLQTNWVTSTSGTWNEQSFAIGDSCINAVLGSSGLIDIYPQNYSAAVNPLNASLQGLAVQLPLSHLSSDTGFDPGQITVTLPGSVSFHPFNATSGQPDRLGVSQLNSLAPLLSNPSDLDTLGVIWPMGFVHSEGLPFYLPLEALILDASGLHGSVKGAHYAYNLSFAAVDPRNSARRGVISNDSRFSGRSFSGNGQLTINAAGLQVSGLEFTALDNAETHYPRLSLHELDAFTADIVNGRLQAGALPSAASTDFTLHTGCNGCSDSDGNIEYHLSETASGLSLDGSVATLVSNLSNAAWGPLVTHNGEEKQIFRRYNDAVRSGILWFPGTFTNNKRVTDTLLGSADVSRYDDSAPPIVVGRFPLGSQHARRGNYFMAGLNVGPEIYMDPNNEGVEVGLGSAMDNSTGLGSTSTAIGFGGAPDPQFRVVESAPATKYVVRPGGVTGAFNFTDLPAPPVYGFDMILSRFAFRVTSNIMDRYSWIDGQVFVPSPGDFSLFFESLDLQCTGQLGSGRMVREACPDGRNCGEMLGAWQTDITLNNFSFVPEDPGLDVCTPQSRNLQVGMTLDVQALSEPLHLQADWKSDGIPTHERLGMVGDQEIDKPENGAGFALAMDDGVSLGWSSDKQSGWYDFNGQMGLPFWDSPQVSVRVANRTAESADQTLLVKQGGLADLDAASSSYVDWIDALADNDSLDLQARYTWGGTGLDFDYPVFYESGRLGSGEEPRLLGRSIPGFDLKLLAARAGVNFVSPENTAVSFGASANFELLRNLEVDLHVDLNDPRSIARFDNWLEDLHIVSAGSKPLENMVGPIVDQKRLVGRITGPAMDEFILAGIKGALKDMGDNLSIDPFDELADAFERIQAIPNQLTAAVEDRLNETLDQAIRPLTDQLDGRTLAFYLKVPGFYQKVHSLDLPDIKAEISPEMWDDIAEARIQEEVAELIEEVTGISSRLAEVQAGAGDLAAAVLEAKQALADILDALTDEYDAELATDRQSGQINRAIELVENLRIALGLYSPGNPNLPDQVCSDEQSLSSNKLANLLAGFAGEQAAAFFTARDELGIFTGLKEPDGNIPRSLPEFAGLFWNYAGFDTDIAERAQQSTTLLVQELWPRIDDAAVGIDNICSGQLSSDLPDDLAQMSRSIDDWLADFQARLEEVRQAIDNSNTGLRVQLLPETGNSGLDDLYEMLLSFQEGVGGLQALLGDHLDIFNDIHNLLGDDSYTYTHKLETIFSPGLDIPTEMNRRIAEIPMPSVADVERLHWDYPIGAAEPVHGFSYGLANLIREPAYRKIAGIGTHTRSALVPTIGRLPMVNSDELRNYIARKVLNSEAVEELRDKINARLAEVSAELNEVVLNLLDQVNSMLREVTSAVEDEINSMLSETAVPLANAMPIRSAKMDGYAVIGRNELEQLHIGAEWTLSSDTDDGATTYGGALDMWSWNANGKASGCGIAPEDAFGMLDATISTRNLPINIGEEEMNISLLELGFTLDGGLPIGLHGGIEVDGDFNFKAFTLYDIGFRAGAGRYENYLGAAAGATFSDIAMESAFLLGKTCNDEVLTSLDPQVGEFLTLPGGVFNGVYVRGSASMPVYSNGCALTVGVAADTGAWVLAGPPLTIGGIVGGGAFGKVLCVGALRGQMTALGQYSSDGGFLFSGEGFGVAGAGFDCDPGTWKTRPRSRRDDWCGTGDAGFSTTYKNGWEVGTPDTSAIH